MLAGLLGAAAAILPSLAAGDPPAPNASFTAVDYAWQSNQGAGNTVTIQPGGMVSFGYPSGGSQHNADFGTGPQPSSCAQTAGTSSGSVPPLPHQQTSPGWSGSCTFSTPGTYTFHCDLHPFMTGTIVVQSSPTTTTTGTTTTITAPTTTSTTPPTTPSTTTQATSPPPVVARPTASARHKQRGHVVRGSLTTPSAYVGGNFEVDVFSGSLRVGRLVQRVQAAGTRTFTVAVHRVGRSHRKLPLTVRVIVRAPGQPTASTRFRVSLIT